MNNLKKATKLYCEPAELSCSLEALEHSLDMTQAYGLDVEFKNGIYQITRHGEDVVECEDFNELLNSTWAIAAFIDVGKRHQKTKEDSHE